MSPAPITDLVVGDRFERQQIVFPLASRSFTWQRDETILVETSRQFDPFALQTQLSDMGLIPVRHYTDAKEWFSLLLFRKGNNGQTSPRTL